MQGSYSTVFISLEFLFARGIMFMIHVLVLFGSALSFYNYIQGLRGLRQAHRICVRPGPNTVPQEYCMYPRASKLQTPRCVPSPSPCAALCVSQQLAVAHLSKLGSRAALPARLATGLGAGAGARCGRWLASCLGALLGGGCGLRRGPCARATVYSIKNPFSLFSFGALR